MMTPEKIISANAVSALEAERYEISVSESMFTAPETWTDENGVVHPNEYTSVPYSVWRDLWGGIKR